MRNAAKILRVYWFGIALSLISLTSHGEVIDKIVAILDDELILLSEIREQTEQPVVQVIANLATSEGHEEHALDYLIEKRLLQREIHFLAFPKETELTKTLALDYLAMAYNHGSSEKLQEELHAHNISETALEKELTLYMKGVDYIRRKYRFNAEIDQPEVVLNLFQHWITALKTKARIQRL